MMSAVKISRKLHKWLGLAVGIQLFLWSVSGFYMVAVDIGIIHGDMLVKTQSPNLGDNIDDVKGMGDVQSRYPEAQRITLTSVLKQPVYVVDGNSDSRLLDAINGEEISPLDEAHAVAIAEFYYAGDGAVRTAELIRSAPPGEIRFMRLPVWRVDFDDAWGTSFYIDPKTGKLSSRRHTLWRVFDFLWMLHIMDYDEREDVNNVPLRIVSALALVLVISGIWLLFYTLKRKPNPTIDSI